MLDSIAILTWPGHERKPDSGAARGARPGRCRVSGLLDAGGSASMESVSCTTAGTFAAVGSYVDGFGHQQAYVVSERNGQWGTAAGVPGLGAPDPCGFAEILSVSCARRATVPPTACMWAVTVTGTPSSATSKTAAGARRSRSQASGHWTRSARASTPCRALPPVPAPPAAPYQDSTGDGQGFVVSQT